ncbi:MAG: hypothetical protein KC729_12655 [Candidatus Eisenbacteria bacterium]|uniref:Right handed beta helix domain-containing protein n=1 Tax=Eiseniibacteriota bacterium TaxID=2212470 RepID=A0A956RQ36_UNCEI|nr:hypothetical protein [Candidatus Eisenbacteria bacterium]
MKAAFFTCIVTTLFALSVNDAHGQPWYVDATAGPGGTGTTPTSALNSIQLAIDMSMSGDTIYVLPGPPYVESIVVSGKSIDILGTAGPAATTIDGTSLGATLVTLENGADGLFEGFTLTNSAGTADGQAMRINSSNPVVRNCHFIDNTTNIGNGGAIFAEASAATVIDCWFQGNVATDGGAFYAANCPADLTVANCVFWQNAAQGMSDNDGGAIRNANSSPRYIHCTICENTAGSDGGGLASGGGGAPEVINCIVWGNSDSNGMGQDAQIYDQPGQVTSVNYSCVMAYATLAGTGCIGLDPEFVNYTAGDFHLLPTSPCIDAGDPVAPGIPPTDVDGETRPQGLAPDMGVDEVPVFTRGDCNDDGGFDIGDPVAALNTLFASGSALPACVKACDANDDGSFDIGDPVFMLSALVASGNPPAPPSFPTCGVDPTVDDLRCVDCAACP